ncbi:MAG TPA: glutamate formimidoyltransferase [Fimbriimonadaceae bacterium]|nr:glutamate formimidoyltransferase [Fimbriimonadaceae bacterium]
MPAPLIECVPNFSEGRDAAILDAIADAIRAVEGVRLLNVDPGQATHRTVYTFVGEPEPVCEAAFQAARVACESIDMSRHTGEHPRFGALDVCPLIPIAGITMEETAAYARRLGQRMGEELGMSIYLYEYAATSEERRNLATLRAGEYEGLEAKLAKPEWKPDFGPSSFNPRSGASAVGARDFLVAFNVNLNTTSVRRANSVAFDVREKGRPKRVGDPITGETLKDDEGNTLYEPGALKAVKAIGWFIEEYGIAQISMNLTNLGITPVHVAFDECCRRAEARGMRVTGSELVGLIPLAAMLDAGRYFLRKQRRSTGVSDAELIRIAILSMGLDDLTPFDPEVRIIEYAMRDRSSRRLVDLTVRGFVEETASESPAPGGGSVSAAMGAMGAALAAMVANLSSHKRGWDERWEEFSDWAEQAKACHDTLLRLIDDDTDAFNRVMAAFGLPKGTPEEKSARSAAIQSATKGAIEVPLQVMEVALRGMAVAERMAAIGNPNSISDAGVGVLACRAAIRGAEMNVRINLGSLKDAAYKSAALERCAEVLAEAEAYEARTVALVAASIDGGG